MSHDIVIIVRSLTANSKLVLLMTNFCYNFVILSSIHFQILLFLSINICTIIICTYLWCSSSLTAFDYFDIQSAAQDNIVGPTKTRSGAKGIYYSALGFFF